MGCGGWCSSTCPRDKTPSANGCDATCATKASAEERQILGGGKINVESLILLEARPCAGESDAKIVAGAWDFERINRRYARHLKVLAERPGGALRNDAAAKALLRWAAAERETWLDAVTNDPLLPGRILLSDYLGQQALVAVRKDRRRVEVLRDARRQLRTFNRA